MSLYILMTSAVSIAFIHTLIGVDHSLPFVVLGRARGWSMGRVLALTALCGLGHVLSSVVLGAFGIGLGVAVSSLEAVEAGRGSIAAWLLIGFGLVYAGYAFARSRRSHKHTHTHANGVVHAHEGDNDSHTHAHAHTSMLKTTTAWSLFVIFVLGPCEPLIPLLMVPAVSLGVTEAVIVATTFGVVTIGTMLLVVALGYYSLKMPVFQRLERHANTLAGLAIAFSGLAIQVFGI